MFGRKKEKKQKIKTFIDGVEQESTEIPIPRPAQPETDVTALEPQAVQEPSPQSQVEQFTGECILCFDFGWYLDQVGVWHNCPRCNPKSLNNTPSKKQLSSADKNIKPTKGNLFEFRSCPSCGKHTEVHKKKKIWKCEHCQWRGGSK